MSSIKRIYIPQLKVGVFVSDDDDLLHRLKDVLRFKSGDHLVLFDGTGMEYRGEISVLAKNKVEIFIEGGVMIKDDSKKVILFQSLLKKDNLEWVAQKATELGVSKIIPVMSKRCVKSEMSENAWRRLNQIIIEAVEQSGGVTVPEVGDVVDFATATAMKEGAGVIAYEGEKRANISSIDLSSNVISVYIGPEGGYDEGEIKMAQDHGIIPVSLGKRILRAETASIAVLSKILL